MKLLTKLVPVLVALAAMPAMAAPSNKVFLLLNGTSTQRVDSTTLEPKFLTVGVGNVVLSDDGSGNLQVSGTISQALASGKILLGNASNIASQVTPTGDVTVSNTGVTTIGSGVIDNGRVSSSAAIAYSKLNLSSSVQNSDISPSAAIDFSKLAALPSADVLLGNGSNVASAVPLTGDVTVANTGVTAISAGVVTDTKAALANKPSVAVVAIANVALTGLQTIDGVAVAANTLVLLTAQTTASQNGPWQAQSGAWTRPTWYPSGGTTQAFQFITCFVRLGGTYQGSVWRQTASGAITIDTTATAWVATPLALNASTVTGSLPNANTSGTSANTPSTLVLRDGSGNFSAGTITAALSGNATTATSAGSFSGSFAGDVTGTQAATVVSLVGGQTASAVASGVTTVQAATSAAVNATLVQRDASGNFAAGLITASLAGNATSATTANAATTAGSAVNFSGSLGGDVTGTQGATVVALVGGSSAVSVASGAAVALAGTALNTPSTLVKRDGSGNFAAGVITAALTGNVTGNVSGTAANVTGIVATANGGTGVNGTAVYPTTGNIQTDSNTFTLTNKSISGSSNTITNVSLTAAVTGVLPTANGGTGQNGTAVYPTSGNVLTDGNTFTVTNKTISATANTLQNVAAEYDFTGDGTTVDFALTQALTSSKFIIVAVDGRLQREGGGNAWTRTNASPGHIVFTSAPDSGSWVDVTVINQ